MIFLYCTDLSIINQTVGNQDNILTLTYYSNAHADVISLSNKF